MKLPRTHEVLGLPLRWFMRCSRCDQLRMCEIFGRFGLQPFGLCQHCERL